MQVLWTARKMNKWTLGQIKPKLSLEAQIVETEVALLWAHHEKTGFSGKDNNSGKR